MIKKICHKNFWCNPYYHCRLTGPCALTWTMRTFSPALQMGFFFLRHFLIFNESLTSPSASTFLEGSKHHPKPALNSVTYSKSSDSQSWKALRSNALMSLSGDRGESCMLSPFQSLLTLGRLPLLLFSLTTKSIKQHQQPFRTTVLWEANAQKELISKGITLLNKNNSFV